MSANYNNTPYHHQQQHPNQHHHQHPHQPQQQQHSSYYGQQDIHAQQQTQAPLQQPPQAQLTMPTDPSMQTYEHQMSTQQQGQQQATHPQQNWYNNGYYQASQSPYASDSVMPNYQHPYPSQATYSATSHTLLAQAHPPHPVSTQSNPHQQHFQPQPQPQPQAQTQAQPQPQQQQQQPQQQQPQTQTHSTLPSMQSIPTPPSTIPDNNAGYATNQTSVMQQHQQAPQQQPANAIHHAGRGLPLPQQAPNLSANYNTAPYQQPAPSGYYNSQEMQHPPPPPPHLNVTVNYAPAPYQTQQQPAPSFYANHEVQPSMAQPTGPTMQVYEHSIPPHQQQPQPQQAPNAQQSWSNGYYQPNQSPYNHSVMPNQHNPYSPQPKYNNGAPPVMQAPLGPPLTTHPQANHMVPASQQPHYQQHNTHNPQNQHHPHQAQQQSQQWASQNHHTVPIIERNNKATAEKKPVKARVKKEPNPNAPSGRRKAPRMTAENRKSGYAEFFKSERSKLPKNLEMKEASKYIAERWSNLSPEERNIYVSEVNSKRREMLKNSGIKQAQALLVQDIKLEGS